MTTNGQYLQHIRNGKVIAFVDLFKLYDKEVKENYPQHYEYYLELLNEPF